MLIRIRSEFERCLTTALPEFGRFNARVNRLSESDLPCINLYFHRDRLVKNGNHYEDRAVNFEIEAAFKAGGDPEAELTSVRKKVEDAVESSDALDRLITDWSLIEVDFGHEMIGNVRVAALAMTYRVEYLRPILQPPAPPTPKEVWLNKEKILG